MENWNYGMLENSKHKILKPKQYQSTNVQNSKQISLAWNRVNNFRKFKFLNLGFEMLQVAD